MKAYGLIGKSLLHSFSKDYFDRKFEVEKIQGVTYQLYELQGLDQLNELIQRENLIGLNVTIPYKEQVIGYIDEIEPNANRIGAVNCIRIVKGHRIGYNTDYIGFKLSIEGKLKEMQKHAVILGNGGAAKAIKYALNQMGIESVFAVRNKRDLDEIEYQLVDKDFLEKHKIVINCTPLGTYPKIDEFPNIPYQFITNQHLCIDLVYNPKETAFLKRCGANGAEGMNGESMLAFQAEESWKLWNEIC